MRKKQMLVKILVKIDTSTISMIKNGIFRQRQTARQIKIDVDADDDERELIQVVTGGN